MAPGPWTCKTLAAVNPSSPAYPAAPCAGAPGDGKGAPPRVLSCCCSCCCPNRAPPGTLGPPKPLTWTVSSANRSSSPRSSAHFRGSLDGSMAIATRVRKRFDQRGAVASPVATSLDRVLNEGAICPQKRVNESGSIMWYLNLCTCILACPGTPAGTSNPQRNPSSAGPCQQSEDHSRAKHFPGSVSHAHTLAEPH
eukprot:scaffold162380_cov15-Tisochrysis_lutea.AAC.2